MNACGETYESLKDFIEIIDLDGMPVTTLDLEGLIKKTVSARKRQNGQRDIKKRALTESKNTGETRTSLLCNHPA